MAQPHLAPGAVFAGYEIVGRLGTGGMGAVYLAKHPNLPRRVALKLLARHLTDDEDIRERFLREAEHAARLEHPNVVTVYDRGDEGGQLWLSMQYVDGEDASVPLIDGPMELARAGHIIGETAKALDYAHELGILHRDVKPANILLASPPGTHEERVYLADFGIAKALEETHRFTASGMFAGSLQYAAPEQFDPHVILDHRTDVYALGCTLFHLVTGAIPYPGKSPMQWMHGHVSAPIPKPSHVRPEEFGSIPAGLDRVVERALAKDRALRYSTCGELADAVKALVAAPVPVRRTSEPTLPPLPVRPPAPMTLPPLPELRPEPARETHPEPPATPPISRPELSPRRGLRLALIAAVVVAIIAGVSAGYWLLAKDRTQDLALLSANVAGAHAFMPSAALTATPVGNLPGLPSGGEVGAIIARPVAGDSAGLYAGELHIADCDRAQIATYLRSHSDSAQAFADALDSDSTLYWSGGNSVAPADLDAFLRELTPARLRFDTRLTHHRFEEGGPKAVQSVLQAGTAVLVDATGLPRVRCISGSPITAPVALDASLAVTGSRWTDYRSDALALPSPSTLVMEKLVLADARSGTAFERPVGTDGSQDTPSSVAIGAFGSG